MRRATGPGRRAVVACRRLARAAGLLALWGCATTSPQESGTPPPRGVVDGPPAAPGAGYRFLVLGDTQRSRGSQDLNDAARAAVYERVRAALSDGTAAFAFHLGDLVETGGEAADWQVNFDAPFWDRLGPAARRRFFPVPGNHEYKTHLLDYGGGDLRLYFARFPHLEHQRYFRFYHGRDAFVALDSGRNGVAKLLFGEGWQNGFEEQEAWLQRQVLPELAERAAAGRLERVFVFFHKPARATPVAVRNRPSARILQLFEALDRDTGGGLTVLAFSGHVHTFAHIRTAAGPGRGPAVDQLTTGGGGGAQAGARHYGQVRRIADLDLYRQQKLEGVDAGAWPAAFAQVRRDDTHFGYLEVAVGRRVEVIYQRFDGRGGFFEDYRFSR